MNRTVINKNINEYDSNADKKLQHGARHFGTHKSIGISAPDPPFDDIKRKQGYQRQNHIAYDKGRKSIGIILRVQIIDKPGQDKAYGNYCNNEFVLHADGIVDEFSKIVKIWKRHLLSFSI